LRNAPCELNKISPFFYILIPPLVIEVLVSKQYNVRSYAWYACYGYRFCFNFHDVWNCSDNDVFLFIL